MNWTWLGLAVLVLLAFSMVDGYRHGFVKEVVSALLVLISVALVWLINPYVNQFIRENTSVYEKSRLPADHLWILWQMEKKPWMRRNRRS